MFGREIPVDQIESAIAGIVRNAETGDFSDVLAGAHFIILEGEAENFSRQVDSQGNPWLPRKDNKKHPLLRLTYAMYAAAATHGGKGQIEQIGPRESTLGISKSTIPYVLAQNFGYAPRNLPAREFYYISDQTEEKLNEYLDRQIAEAMFRGQSAGSGQA